MLALARQWVTLAAQVAVETQAQFHQQVALERQAKVLQVAAVELPLELLTAAAVVVEQGRSVGTQQALESVEQVVLELHQILQVHQ